MVRVVEASAARAAEGARTAATAWARARSDFKASRNSVGFWLNEVAMHLAADWRRQLWQVWRRCLCRAALDDQEADQESNRHALAAAVQPHAASFSVRSELVMRRAAIAEWQQSGIAVRPGVVCNC